MREIDSFAAAEAYLRGTINETISRRTSYKLDRIARLLRELGDPQNAYPTVHVGGTSGKGSTSTMIATALQASGKRTGLHTKPHLRSVTERAVVNGLAISEERFAELLDEMMPAIEATAAEFGRATYYETLLALAFLHFARERVDVAVIEVGLGGRLDGTNVIVPVVAAITSVGFDHTEVLGDTLEAIATEKAGIAKKGVPLVVATDEPEALQAIERVAAEAGAPVVRVSQATRVEERRRSGGTQSVTVVTPRARYALELPVFGEFQRTNARTAIAVLEQLPRELAPPAEQVEDAFLRLAIPGRMEIFAGNPTVVFDIAHNAEKAEHLVASLAEEFPGRRIHYVVAIGESKDAREILRTFVRLPSTLTFTAFEVSGRPAIRPARLALVAQALGAWGRAIEDPVEALNVARRAAGAGEVVVVTGSTFVVADLRAWWVGELAESRR